MQPNEFVTGDTHFGHKAILKYANRPFEDVNEMNETFIENWNKKVPKNARVYHLGDFSFMREEETIKLIDRLNGRICLVRGNHDRVVKNSKVSNKFEWVRDYYESKTSNNIKVCMWHYAALVWNKSHHGSWMLHGHSHGSLPDAGIPRIDVGIDLHPNYEPFSYWEIVERMRGRKYQGVDHHVHGGKEGKSDGSDSNSKT